ncbi:hypothetical protein KIN20_037174 [Parelaphostrongylus tenuis]|uniref:Probable arginine--tRNA ligase, mitochondrial n=1 Tax=Parelaphostrongylus tenuis TaxID=148309 RepID=A0AAD5WKZ3_PARTN|nr:hypothetical protein KIN20_037174 [Parelaphostrongylus tenuis]
MNAGYLRQLRPSGALKTIVSDRINNQQCQKIVIDYSSPNIGKQFHVGNLRSTLIGKYLDKVHRAIGNQVISVNYLGDWGTQFATIAAYWPKVRPSDSYWDSCSDVEKIRAITDCYVVANKKKRMDENFRDEVRQTFAEMESQIMNGDFSSSTMRLWKDIREISERHLKHFYSLWHYESTYVPGARCLVLRSDQGQSCTENEHRYLGHRSIRRW